MQKINETRSWFFEKIFKKAKNNKPVTRFIKKGGERNQIKNQK